MTVCVGVSVGVSVGGHYCSVSVCGGILYVGVLLLCGGHYCSLYVCLYVEVLLCVCMCLCVGHCCSSVLVAGDGVAICAVFRSSELLRW